MGSNQDMLVNRPLTSNMTFDKSREWDNIRLENERLKRVELFRPSYVSVEVSALKRNLCDPQVTQVYLQLMDAIQNAESLTESLVASENEKLRQEWADLKKQCRTALNRVKKLANNPGSASNHLRECMFELQHEHGVLAALLREKPQYRDYPTEEELDAFERKIEKQKKRIADVNSSIIEWQNLIGEAESELREAEATLRSLARSEQFVREQLGMRSGKSEKPSNSIGL